MPPTPTNAALGMYLSGVGLESLLEDLTRVGFLNEEVCAVLPQSHCAADSLVSSKSLARSCEDAPGEDALADWFAQFGAVIIPGVGSFVAGREFVGVLFGSTNGEMSCGNALRGLGLPPAQAERLQGWVLAGGVIVYVCCKTEDRVSHAIEVLEEAGAEEVSRVGSSGSERVLDRVPLLKAS